MAAAARIEAAGGHVIHMEVGQPAAPAPRTALAAARAALDDGRIDYTAALGIPSLRARIARHYRETYGCDGRSRADRGHHRLVGRHSSWRFLRCSSRATASRSTEPGYPPYRHILTALGCEPVLIETSSETRYALTGEALARGASQDAAEGRAGRKPRQSDRHHDDARGAGRPDRGGRERRHPLHLRRDLSRPRLRVSGGDRGRAFAARARDQFVLEIFLHDRLARRLDGGAGAAGAADRAAAAESRDLGADAVADRGRSRLRRRAPRWKRSSTATRRTAAS